MPPVVEIGHWYIPDTAGSAKSILLWVLNVRGSHLATFALGLCPAKPRKALPDTSQFRSSVLGMGTYTHEARVQLSCSYNFYPIIF